MNTDEQSKRDQDRQNWRLAATLFVGGGLGAIPSDALHQPPHPPTVYLLPLLALVSGAICWLLSERADGRWLHAMTVIATLEVALTVELADQIFAIYFVFIAIYAAYVFDRRFEIIAQVALASLATLAPIAYDPDSARETLIVSFALVPTLALAAGAVTFLREQLEASEERYRRLAERDPLTGVGNYRLLADRLPVELERHRRHGGSLALVLIDLDEFKRVNDEHGHQHGDRVLREVGMTLLDSVRSHDIVARHGGDEFCVLAPQTDRERAEELGARIRTSLGKVTINGRSLSGSTGYAVFPHDADDHEQLIARADVQLREAKGRKRTR